MKITFATDHTTAGGRTYKAGTTAEINNAAARSLILRGKALPATEATSAPAETTSAAAETETPEGDQKGTQP